MPKVSVVMSCFNEEHHVGRAIQSILNQTFTDFEFIILNDGSTDRTLEVIQSFLDRDDRIKLHENKSNLGLAASLNKGIRAAKGQYIARMDADDISFENRLQIQTSHMDMQPDIDILGSNALMKQLNKSTMSAVPLSHHDIKRHAFHKTCIIHPTVMMKKSCFDKGGYDESLPWAEDKDLWLRWMNIYKFANLEESLIEYTVKERITWKIFYYNHLVLVTNLIRMNMLASHFSIVIKSVLSHLKKMMRV